MPNNFTHYNEYDSSTTVSKDKKSDRKREHKRGAGKVKVIVNSNFHAKDGKRVKKAAKNLTLK
jgi:hypothetical protein